MFHFIIFKKFEFDYLNSDQPIFIILYLFQFNQLFNLVISSFFLIFWLITSKSADSYFFFSNKMTTTSYIPFSQAKSKTSFWWKNWWNKDKHNESKTNRKIFILIKSNYFITSKSSAPFKSKSFAIFSWLEYIAECNGFCAL